MDRQYFPNQPKEILTRLRSIRTTAMSLDPAQRLELFQNISHLGRDLVATEFKTEDGKTLVLQEDERMAFPHPLPPIKFEHILCGYQDWLSRKYSLPGFVEVEAGDIVVDCGAFVGGFSLGAARLASQVVAFEPEPENFACLSQNAGAGGKIHCENKGLYSSTGSMRLNISDSAVEHSFLEPDDGVTVKHIDVPITTLSAYVAEKSLDRIDFLKLEAEGVELEIHEGLAEIRPRKLAIDVSPERNGESPAGEFEVRLSSAGYQIRRRGNVLFARLEGV
jgi:FkbM family methyltransferase